MSFILDALKKLEREKQVREPGVVMVGPVPWGGADRGRSRWRIVLSGVAVAAIVGGTLWWLAPASRVDPAPTRDAAAGKTPSPPPPVAPSNAAAQTQREATALPDETSTAPRRRPAITPPAPVPRTIERPADEARAPQTDEPRRVVSATSSAPAAETPTATEEVQPAAPAEAGQKDDEFRLSAISTRGGEPVALLNDRLVREGDAFDGVRILRIGTTEIEIEIDGERRTIGF